MLGMPQQQQNHKFIFWYFQLFVKYNSVIVTQYHTLW